MERISSYQWFTLLVFFQIGSTAIFGFATNARQDAWIVLLIANILGMLLIFVYILLMRLQPGLLLVEWFPKQFGRALGTPIAWLYPLAFIYTAGRVLRDMNGLTQTILLEITPWWVISGTFMIIIVYCLLQGIENIARLSGFLFPLLILGLYFIEVILLFFSGVINWENLLPVNQIGFKNILKYTWPLNVTVPYGESIVFAMFWTTLYRSKHILKVSLAATATYGSMALLSTLLVIATLGSSVYGNSFYPLFQAIRLIEVVQFISNLDPLVTLQILFDAFFKIVLFMYGAIVAIEQLSGFKNRPVLILIVACTVILLEKTMAVNVSQHALIGLKIVPFVLWIPLFIVFPVLLLAVIWIRNKLPKKQAKQV